MNILDKRPLCLILCVTLGTFVLFTFTGNFILKIILSVLPILLFALTFFKPIKRHLKSFALKRTLIISSALAMLFSFLYFDIWFKPYERFDDEVTVYAEITDMSTDKSTYITLKTDNINSEFISKYKLDAYIDRDDATNLSIGSEVKIKGRIVPVYEAHSLNADSSYYAAKGISGSLVDISSVELIKVNDFTLEYKLSSAREGIARKFIVTSDENSGGLLAALLLGEQEYLPSETKLDFRRLGISHILALSGMHLVILSAAINKLLLMLKLGKKSSTFITMLFTLFYMIFTGMPVSIVRAGLMLLITSILYLLSQTHDAMTGLFISVFIILCFEPYAVYDISLWLSAFATLGILALSDYLKSNKCRLNFLVSTSLASLFAVFSTFTLCVLSFPETSVAAIPATLIFSLLTELYMYSGIIHLLLSAFINTGAIISYLGNFIIKTASFFSGFDFVQILVTFNTVKILALIFAVFFFGFLVANIKRKKTAIALLTVFLVSIFSVSAVLTFNARNDRSISYINQKDEQIFVTDNGEVALLYIGNYSENSVYSTINFISENHITYLNTFIPLNYEDSLPQALKILISNIKTETIMMPEPKCEEEFFIYEDIEETLKHSDTELIMFDNNGVFSLNETKISLIDTEIYGIKDSTVLNVFQNDKMYTYLTPDALEDKIKPAALDIISKSDVIIIGNRGNDKKYIFNYKCENCEKLIVGSKKTFLQESIFEYYYSNGDVYFTPKYVDLTH